jgi:glycyl-tRNA synthetase beta subunit
MEIPKNKIPNPKKKKGFLNFQNFQLLFNERIPRKGISNFQTPRRLARSLPPEAGTQAALLPSPTS